MKNILLTICIMMLWNTHIAQTVINAEAVETKTIEGVNYSYYNNQPFTGIVVDSFAQGKPKLWKNVKNGLSDGLWQEWLENGQLRYHAYWKDGKGHGLWQYFHDNGALKYEESYILDIANGISRAYFNNGQLQNDMFWLQGKKHGEWKYYTINGELEKIEYYTDDELISTRTLKK